MKNPDLCSCRSPKQQFSWMLFSAFLLLFGIFAQSEAMAKVIYVDVQSSYAGVGIGSSWGTAYGDLQLALDAAEANDELWVKAGTYTHTANSTSTTNFNVRTAVKMYGGFPADEAFAGWADRDWVSHPTILDGQGLYRNLYVSANALVDGFVITNGGGDAYGGAGVKIAYAAATLRNCVVKNNGPAPGETHLTGGGVQISNTTAGSKIVNCLIADNSALQGGGIMVAGGSTGDPVKIINSTVVRNHASDQYGYTGGGLRNAGGYLQIANSIFWGNTAYGNVSTQLWFDTLGAQRTSIAYSDVQGGIPAGVTSVGNINQDPMFTGLDARLTSTSPCLDKGSNSYLPVDADDLDRDGNSTESLPFDLDGGTRVFDGDGYGGANVDMGAYEYGTSVALSLRVVRTSFIEGESPWECAIDLSEALGNSLQVTLTSSDDSEMSVPASVTFAAGETTKFFNLTIVDDTEIDGRQSATITATAPGVKGASSDVIEIIDDEVKLLTLNVQSTVTEGEGVINSSVFVHLSGSLPTPTDVYLSSSNNALVEVAPYVTVGSNTLNASSWLRVLDNETVDGTRNVKITAWIPADEAWSPVSVTISVADDEVPPVEYALGINVSGEGTTVPAVGEHAYPEGSVVLVQAIPASGWRFDGWSGSLSGNANPANLIIDGGKNVTATFSQIPPDFGLDLRIEGNGAVTVNPPNTTYTEATLLTYSSGTTFHLQAIPAAGSVFVGWEGNVQDAFAATTLTQLDADKTITARFAPDDDADGISTSDEQGPSGMDVGYDGNGDGIADKDQANVASAYTHDYAHYLTLAATKDAGNPDVALEEVRFDPIAAPSTAPTGMLYPYGMVGFKLTNIVSADGSASVVLYLRESDPIPTTYYKYGKTPTNAADHWYEFNYDATSKTGAQINGRVITLHFVDGERGDGDLVKNGVIVDPGAPATLIASTTTGDGGNCFIATAAYGSYLEPQVRVLREFRDRILLTHPAGVALVDFYYTHSPMVAGFIASNDGLKALVRVGLTPIVAVAYLLLNTSPAQQAALLVSILGMGIIGLRFSARVAKDAKLFA